MKPPVNDSSAADERERYSDRNDRINVHARAPALCSIVRKAGGEINLFLLLMYPAGFIQLDQAQPIAFPPRSGFCLEPHAFPNAINEPRFPDITLRAGERYRYEVSYAFRAEPSRD